MKRMPIGGHRTGGHIDLNAIYVNGGHIGGHLDDGSGGHLSHGGSAASDVSTTLKAV